METWVSSRHFHPPEITEKRLQARIMEVHFHFKWDLIGYGEKLLAIKRLFGCVRWLCSALWTVPRGYHCVLIPGGREKRPSSRVSCGKALPSGASVQSCLAKPRVAKSGCEALVRRGSSLLYLCSLWSWARIWLPCRARACWADPQEMRPCQPAAIAASAQRDVVCLCSTWQMLHVPHRAALRNPWVQPLGDAVPNATIVFATPNDTESFVGTGFTRHHHTINWKHTLWALHQPRSNLVCNN